MTKVVGGDRSNRSRHAFWLFLPSPSPSLIFHVDSSAACRIETKSYNYDDMTSGERLSGRFHLGSFISSFGAFLLPSHPRDDIFCDKKATLFPSVVQFIARKEAKLGRVSPRLLARYLNLFLVLTESTLFARARVGSIAQHGISSCCIPTSNPNHRLRRLVYLSCSA